MSKVQTDNDFLDVKIKLRIDHLPSKPEIMVLDCFSGDGIIWNSIIKKTGFNIKILRIDQKPNKNGIYLKGDNIKFIKSFDLSVFDIIDLDAYGVPFNQLEIIFQSNFTGIIFGTFIQSMNGALNSNMLEKIGYSKNMVKKIPSLFNCNGFEKFCNYLQMNGINTIFDYSYNRKHYFMFNLNQRQ